MQTFVSVLVFNCQLNPPPLLQLSCEHSEVFHVAPQPRCRCYGWHTTDGPISPYLHLFVYKQRHDKWPLSGLFQTLTVQKHFPTLYQTCGINVCSTVCVCVYAISMHAYVCMYVCICSTVLYYALMICTCVCIYTCVNVYKCVHARTHVRICVYMYMCMYMCVLACTMYDEYMCMYSKMCTRTCTVQVLVHKLKRGNSSVPQITFKGYKGSGGGTNLIQSCNRASVAPASPGPPFDVPLAY